CPPDGMRGRRDAVYGYPPPGIYLAHQQQVHIVPEIVLVRKRLVEPRNMGKAIKTFGKDQKSRTKKKLVPDLPPEDKKGQKQGKGKLCKDVPQLKGKAVPPHRIVQHPPEEQPPAPFYGMDGLFPPR